MRDLVPLARITRAHGVRGDVKVLALPGGGDTFDGITAIWLGDDNRRGHRRYRIEKWRRQGKFILLKLRGIEDRSAAAALAGEFVWVRRRELPPRAAGAWSPLDFMGLRVSTEEGEELGEVTAFLETGGHGVLTVSGNEREYLVPLHADFVVRRTRNEVIMRLPPGLLDMNA